MSPRGADGFGQSQLLVYTPVLCQHWATLLLSVLGR